MWTHRWTLCVRLKNKKLLSPQWWRRSCQSLVSRVSATGQQLLSVCTHRLSFICVCACVCHLSLLSCSVWVSYLGFNSLVSFWFWPLTASLPQKFPTSATNWARRLRPSSRRTRWWIRRYQHNTLALIQSFQMMVKGHADSEGWKTGVKLTMQRR